LSALCAAPRDDSLYFGFARSPAIFQTLYRYFPDQFDFVGMVEQVLSVQNRTYDGVRNEVTGLGGIIFNNASFLGSTRLQGIIHYPIQTFFDLAEPGSLHEIGHRWMMYSNGTPLGPGNPHWPLSSIGSAIMGVSGGPTHQGVNFPYTLEAGSNGEYLARCVSISRSMTSSPHWGLAIPAWQHRRRPLPTRQSS
jgi:hypothetical protein